MKRPLFFALCLGPMLLAPLCLSCSDGKQAPELVLLISVDTLRADHLGFYGDAVAQTPNLDALADESVVFEHAFAPSSFTVPSVTTMLSGFYPEENAVYSNEHVLPESVPTAAGHLSKRGYRCGAVVSNFVLRSSSGLGREFLFFDDAMHQRESVRGFPERVAEDTARDALVMLDRLLAEGDGKVFLWVHFQDPHGPYTPTQSERQRFLAQEMSSPDGMRELELGKDHRGLGTLPDYQLVDGSHQVAFYRAGYRAEIAGTDKAIGSLLEGVKARVPWDQTLTIFAADHGEGLGERDYWFAHGEYLDESLIRVPLMLKVPGVEPGRRTDLAGLIDLIPTLLPLVGLAPDPDLAGRNLLAPGADSFGAELYLASLQGGLRPRVGLVADGHIFVATQMGAKEVVEELFRLGQPGLDRAEENSELLNSLRAKLRALRPDLRARGEERRQSLTEADRAAMRALGYSGDH